MLSELERRPMVGGDEGSFGDELEKEIGMLLREPRRQEADDRDRELSMFRSGSAPPTVEGSLSAIGDLFSCGGGSAFPEFPKEKNGNGFTSEEEFRSDPQYLSYYYSNVNLNPRLPPPLLSKEDWRFAQRLKGASGLGGIGDRRQVNEVDDNSGRCSMFSVPSGFDSSKAENQLDKAGSSTEWGGDGLIGLPGLGLGSKKKGFAEFFQDDLGRAISVMGHSSRPASRNAFDGKIEVIGSAEPELAHMRGEMASANTLRSPPNGQGSSAVQNSYTYAAALGASLSRSATPDLQLGAQAPSPCPMAVGGGGVGNSEKRTVSGQNGLPVSTGKSADLETAISGLSLSTNGMIDDESQIQSQIQLGVDSNQNYCFGLQGKGSGHGTELNNSSVLAERQAIFSSNLYLKGSPTSSGLAAQYHCMGSPNSSLRSFDLGGYSANPALASMSGTPLGASNLPPLYDNPTAALAVAYPGFDSRAIGGNALQPSFLDPVYLQYSKTSEYAARFVALNESHVDANFLGNSCMNLVELQKGYIGTLLSPEKSLYGMGGKSGGSNHGGFYGNPAFGNGMPYHGSHIANHTIPNSTIGPGSPLRHSQLSKRFPSSMRNSAGGFREPWSLDESFPSSLLEEFKSNKTKSFELLEISNHVVEFSVDQYGSRFIQQKLETATREEKNMVYEEIMPNGLALMTDVFGNYVIQKFFEHGLPSQRRELANKLFGHVLSLSLQMYGCRVIQKAIEVVDQDQKIKMVQELDGHVMRCVRDQNGNHVIQKCIECVPEENIYFIVSTFFDQVVTLSTHPYGCRVIQRILEHCSDPKTQSKVMDEILGAVSMLAQDQYGNYVVQHVLEHGKPHERSAIIKELAGKIVQMSQQKFASNVVEKCLTFGGPTEHQLLVNEMLGSTDENEPLQAMMKDQFANYVVQKVLETCDDQQGELILSRIKAHLNALKKYTYGKHIVARVEKLVAAGERRIAAQSSYYA